MTGPRRASTPGLDVQALRALRRSRRSEPALVDRVAEHLDAHGGYVAFSTGKDSLVALHLAVQAAPDVPVVHFDSGLAYPESQEYLEEIADVWDLNLTVIRAEPTVLQVLAASGAWDHDAADAEVPEVMDVAVLQPAAKAHARFGAGEVWGVRAAESKGRRFAYGRALAGARAGAGGALLGQCPGGGVIRRQDGTVAFGPIWDWSTSEVWEYIARHGLPVNPVYERLAALGVPEHERRVSHLVDGAIVHWGAARTLKRGWPDLHSQLVGYLPRLAEFS